jgi:hypothetical protein
MTDSPFLFKENLLHMIARLVATHVSHSSVSVDELYEFIKKTHKFLAEKSAEQLTELYEATKKLPSQDKIRKYTADSYNNPMLLSMVNDILANIHADEPTLKTSQPDQTLNDGE